MDVTGNRLSLWLIVTIALISMVGPFSIDTYLPSFPAIETDFHVNRVLLSQSIGFYLLASAVSTLFWGALSDSIGRRKIILGTLGIYLFASLGCALASDFSTFLLFRVIQGIAASGGMVAGRAMIRDSFNSQQAHRAMAYVMMLFALAPAIAPIIGGWLHDVFGWRSVFYFLAMYGLTIMLMSQFFLQESLRQNERKSFHPLAIIRVYCSTVKNARFVALIMTLGACFGGLFIYISGSPTLIFDILKMDSTQFSVLFVPFTSGIILGAFVSGKLSHKWSTPKIVMIALIVMGVASMLNITQAIWFNTSVYSVVAPMLLYAFGVAIALPGISILALDCFPQNRGSASAVQSFTQTILAAISTSIVVPMLTANIIDFAIAQTLFFTVSLVFWMVVIIGKGKARG